MPKVPPVECQAGTGRFCTDLKMSHNRGQPFSYAVNAMRAQSDTPGSCSTVQWAKMPELGKQSCPHPIKEYQTCTSIFLCAIQAGEIMKGATATTANVLFISAKPKTKQLPQPVGLSPQEGSEESRTSTNLRKY